MDQFHERLTLFERVVIMRCFNATICWWDAPKRIEKIIPNRLLNWEIEKPGSKFNSGLVLISFRTTGPRTITPSCLRSSIPLSLYATDRHTIILIDWLFQNESSVLFSSLWSFLLDVLSSSTLMCTPSQCSSTKLVSRPTHWPVSC